ncbi:MAG: type II secretion system protein [Desulfurivibrio sp.]|nr:type II secretion system protein [Desulfurivibrio sp.]
MLRPPSTPAEHKRGPTAPGHQWRRRPGKPGPGHPGTGFTLLEVIVVLVILGILAAVAVNRTGNDDTEIQTRTATLKSHLRYAQLRALNSGGPAEPVIWGIKSDGGSYWLFRYKTKMGSLKKLSGCPVKRLMRMMKKLKPMY